MQSINPATEEVIAQYPELNEEELEAKLDVAHRAFSAWKQSNMDFRRERMVELARLLRSNKNELAQIATLEMGKPITQSMAEVEKCAWVCEYYAENAEKMLAHEVMQSSASESYVRFDPIGVILAVMPWNFPYWQVFRFIAPAAMAGNVGVLKHASNVQGCALAMEKLFEKADFPEGVFQNLSIGASKVEHVIRDPRVVAVTLTGSEPAGRKVAAQAGEHLKKVVLELGGSDPFIVLKDADLDLVLKVAPLARLQNAGQSCIAAKRFIVAQEVAEEFVSRLKIEFEKYKVGDPLDEFTQMGPMVNAAGVEEIHRQVEASVALGAQVVTGGKKLEQKGFFYAPTILKNVKKGMPAYHEEFFGPVASVMVFEEEHEAIHMANDVSFGLGSSIFTQDVERAKHMAGKIDAGQVFINGMVTSDPRLPFGGTKNSGYGRELSYYGMKEFVNIKTVWVK